MADKNQERPKRTATLSSSGRTAQNSSSSHVQNLLMADTMKVPGDKSERSSKDDSNDRDYKQPAVKAGRAKNGSTGTERKSKYDDLSKEALISMLTTSQGLLAEVRKKRAEDRKEWFNEKQKRGQLQNDNKDLLKKVEHLKKDCRELRRTNILQKDDFDNTLEEKTEQFADAHEDLMAKATELTYPSLPDNLLRDQFHSLWARCRQWIREFYIDHITDDSMPFFEEIIGRCTSDRRGPTKEQLLEKLKSGGTTLLRAMGFAWLSREMVQSFLESPFFACGSSRRLLDEFYRASKQKNPKRAYAWRAETLRLNRDNLGIQPLETRRETAKSEAVDHVCASTVGNILFGSQAVVLRVVSASEISDRRAELQEICRSFCLLALELWCQKSEVDVVADAVLLAQPFAITSELLQPHVSMGLDDDDRRFDNVLPHAVLVPAIRIFGDPNGNNLQQEKIMSRSIVLIFDDPPPEAEYSALPEVLQAQSQIQIGCSTSPESGSHGASKKRKRSS